MRTVCLLVFFLQFCLCFMGLLGTVCKEGDLMEDVWTSNPRYKEHLESRLGEGEKPSTPRSVLQALRKCLVYYGDIIIKINSAEINGFGEYVRSNDLDNLRNLQEVHGIVHLDLLKYPEIKSLSFFSSLRLIQSSNKPGFTLTESQVEMIGFSSVRLNVSFINIEFNEQLCYLENVTTINAASEFNVSNNKDPKICARQGKVCSPSCDPSKGCWGPRDLHCFECRYWRAGDVCVDRCDARHGFFTPSNATDRNCGRCHEDCKGECPQECGVCKEEAMWKQLWIEKPRYKIEMDSRGGISWTPRTLLKELRNCRVFYGNIKVKEFSAENNGFGEYVRSKDLDNLRNLREVHGIVHLDLLKYPEIKSLSFFSSLRLIQSSIKGFNLIRSQVEMIGFRNVRLQVVFIGIGENDHLCYMENFRTINSSTRFIITRNKDAKICANEDKICSRSCNSSKGCWGPRDLHCFECQYWRAGDDCVDTCEARRDFFTPPDDPDRVCGRCHGNCTNGCFGPRSGQCYRRAEPIDHCQEHKFFDTETRQCEECPPTCFGAGYANRSRATIRACSGPGNWTGPGGCSFRCPGTTFLTVSSDGRFECSPWRPDCRLCRNATSSGCLQQGMEPILAIVAGVALCLTVIVFGLCVILLRRRRPLLKVKTREYVLLDQQTSPASDIFVSYHRENEAAVQRICSHLVELGFSCGMNAAETGDSEMKNCKVVLACLTSQYMECEASNIVVARAAFLRHQSSSNLPEIIPLTLEDMEWPPRDTEVPMNLILSQKSRFKIHEDGGEGNGEMDELMKQLCRIGGTELCVLYHPEAFSVADTRPEVQSRWRVTSSGLRVVNCAVPGLQSGEVAFDVVQKALQPVFTDGKIRSIGQIRGHVNDTQVVHVSTCDEDADGEEDTGYESIDGRHYLTEEVEEKKFIAIIAHGDDEMEQHLEKEGTRVIEKGGQILIFHGRRRTVLFLNDLSSGRSEQPV